jgi:glycine/D-amino acid oxidase-like deaminating enzyme
MNNVNLRKIAVIGCGFVGSASAFALMQSKLFSEIVLIDADHAKAEGEAAQKAADAQLKGAKTQETIVKDQVLANTPPEAPQQGNPELEAAKAQHEADLAEREFEHRRVLDYQKLGLQRQQHNDKLALQAQQAAQERMDRRAEASREAAMAAQKPQTTQPTKGLR